MLCLLQTVRDRNLLSSISTSVSTSIATHSKAVRYVLIFISSLLLSLLFHLITSRYNVLNYCILAFDIISIILLSLIFITAWYNYNTNNLNTNYISFGFLIILINSVLFLCFYSEIGFRSSLYKDLKNNYELISRLIKAIILFVSLSGTLHFRLKRLNHLIITLFISTIISLTIYLFPVIFPYLTYDFIITSGKHSSLIYMITNSLSISLFCFCIYIIIKKIKNLKYLKVSYYHYILLGLLTSLANSICFTLHMFNISYFFILGYLLKTISYFCFFKAFYMDNEIDINKSIDNGNTLEIENVKLQANYIINSINSFVLIVDKNSKVVSCNRLFHEVTGIKPGNAIGMTLKQLYKALNLSFLNVTSIKEKYINSSFKTREVMINSIDGEEKHIIFRISPVKDVGNKSNGFIITGSDITILKEEQQNIQHQEKLAIIGQLGSGIVHETKNMLASIKGYCQLIHLKSDNDYVKNYTKRIEEITNEVNKIITEFLAFSKPTPQKFNKVFLNEIILSVKYMLESPSFIKGVKLELHLTEHEKPVYADEFQIKQVILNMVKNAIEAMDETSSPLLVISTSLSYSKHEMILKISDNGKGLPKEDLPKLCKPFYTTKEYGTGLGLSTSYRIIKEHNGKISVESEIGKGTTFTIFLPCKPATKNH